MTSPGLTPLEQAVGMPLGAEASIAAVEPSRHETPWNALVEAFAPVLAQPPVLLAFSGGRDSSLLLAAAVECSRRHGLEPAIPITYRNAAAPEMEEDAWQQLVIEHFGVTDWERVEGRDELDFLGPIARAAVTRHGVRFTPNAHFVVPLARRARGGTLILGLGGDELFAGWRWRERADVLARRASLAPSNVGTVLLGSAPRAARRAFFSMRSDRLDAPWLTAVARRLLATAAGELDDQPPRWDRFVDWSVRRRRLHVTLDTLHSLVRGEGAQLSLPLLDPRFLSALAGAGGAHGWSDRAETMAAVADGHLPEQTIQRHGKAVFDEVYWSSESRRFAERWSGTLPRPDLIDAEALRREWLSRRPRFRAALLLQAAWQAEDVIKNVDGHRYGAVHRH
jgi:asparagine synthetase B (glutamine-hydrolysing)